MAIKAEVWAQDFRDQGLPCDPVVRITWVGTHDVERLLWLLDHGNVEQIQLGASVYRRLRDRGFRFKREWRQKRRCS